MSLSNGDVEKLCVGGRVLIVALSTDNHKLQLQRIKLRKLQMTDTKIQSGAKFLACS